MAAYKHYFFDMDGTLTESRTFIDPEMMELVSKLADKYDVTVVSGADIGQISKQIGHFYQRVSVLAQNGNDAIDEVGRQLWSRKLDWRQKLKTLSVIDEMILEADVEFAVKPYDTEADLVEDRNCQISYSLIGHHAPLVIKTAVDPKHKIRAALLEEFRMELSELRELGVHARAGGTTCIDFFTHNKGQNVHEYLELRSWNPRESVYVGDALFRGGNDETVHGYLDTVAVRDPEETKAFIRTML